LNSLDQNESSTSFFRFGAISLWRMILFTGSLRSVINEVTSSRTDFLCAFVNQGSGQMISIPIEYLFISFFQSHSLIPACHWISVSFPILYMSQFVSTTKWQETGHTVSCRRTHLIVHSPVAVWCKTIYSQVFIQSDLFFVSSCCFIFILYIVRKYPISIGILFYLSNYFWLCCCFFLLHLNMCRWCSIHKMIQTVIIQEISIIPRVCYWYIFQVSW